MADDDAPEARSRLSTAGFLYGSRLYQAALGFGTSIIVARVLGPEHRGRYFLATTLALGSSVLAGLSMEAGAFWAVAERRAGVQKLFEVMGRCVLAAVVLASAGYLVVGVSFGLLSPVPALTIVSGLALVPVVTTQRVLDKIAFSVDRTELAAKGILVAATTYFLLVGLLAAVEQLSSTSVVLSLVASGLMGQLVPGVGLARAASRVPDESQPFGIRDIMRVGAENHLGVAAVWLGRRADVLVLANFVDGRSLGIYTLAITLTDLILLSSDVLAQSALGLQGSLSQKDSAKLSVRLAADSARIAGIQAALLVTVGWLLILVTFGREWTGVYPISVALAPGIMALAYIQPLVIVFIRHNRSLESAKVIAAGAALKLVATVLLAEPLGVIAVAAISSVIWILAALVLVRRFHQLFGLKAWAPTGLHPGGYRSR